MSLGDSGSKETKSKDCEDSVRDNQIAKIEGLSWLTELRRLYLSSNEDADVEGLSKVEVNKNEISCKLCKKRTARVDCCICITCLVLSRASKSKDDEYVSKSEFKSLMAIILSLFSFVYMIVEALLVNSYVAWIICMLLFVIFFVKL